MKEKINIFAYDNYRTFLKDAYAHFKAHDKRFSYRYFSRVAGFKSTNFLKLVMDGESNLSLESIEKFAKALKLNKEESLFFRYLVLLNQADSLQEKQIYATEIMKFHNYRKIYPLKEFQYQFFSQWYLGPIWELVSAKGFKEDPQWIANRLIPPITPTEARKALESLIRLGLLHRDPQGRLVRSEVNIATPDEVISALLVQYHREMMKRASEAIDTVARDKRDISSVSFSTSWKSAQKIKEIIQNFRRDILKVASEDQTSEVVYHLNLQFFPLAAAENERGD